MRSSGGQIGFPLKALRSQPYVRAQLHGPNHVTQPRAERRHALRQERIAFQRCRAAASQRPTQRVATGLRR